MRRGRPALGLGALLFAAAAGADDGSLEAVRGALRQFAGATPVHAALERAVTFERKGAPREEGRASLEVTAGPGGISVGYAAGLLEQIRAERAQTDPEQPQPTRRTLENLDAADIAELLNAATGLLSDLDGATLRSDQPVAFEGRPARLLELDLIVRASKADSRWLKRRTWSMRLWTTPDGVPLALDSEFRFTVGLLIFTFDGTEQRTRRYARAGDRLVALHATARFDGEGLGESQHMYSDIRVRLQPGG